MDTKKTFGTNLRIYRKRLNLTIEDVAKKIGTTKSCVSYWENGKSQPSADALAKLCQILNVNAAQLYTPLLTEVNEENYNTLINTSDKPKNAVKIHKVKVPILGTIACGQPIFADESFESYASVSDDIHADFGLWAQGDSMIGARIYDGDLVFIRQQDMVENGEIAAVLIEDEATLRRVYYDQQNATLTLMPANPQYPPFVYHGEELNKIKILGKAVSFMSIVR